MDSVKIGMEKADPCMCVHDASSFVCLLLIFGNVLITTWYSVCFSCFAEGLLLFMPILK